MALKKTNNHPLVITQSLPPSWQLTFSSIDNHLVPWETNSHPLLSPPHPLALPGLCQSSIRLLSPSVFLYLPSPAGLPPFYFISLGPSRSPGPQKTPTELTEGVNGDKVHILP